jgi:hypothetical protein
VRHELSLAGVLSSVACVEKTPTNRYKGIVKVTTRCQFRQPTSRIYVTYALRKPFPCP